MPCGTQSMTAATAAATPVPTAAVAAGVTPALKTAAVSTILAMHAGSAVAAIWLAVLCTSSKGPFMLLTKGMQALTAGVGQQAAVLFQHAPAVAVNAGAITIFTLRLQHCQLSLC